MESLYALLGDALLWGATTVLFILVFLIPARVLQKRHGYAPWLLVFAAIPYAGPLAMLWVFALSNPSKGQEVTA